MQGVLSHSKSKSTNVASSLASSRLHYPYSGPTAAPSLASPSFGRRSVAARLPNVNPRDKLQAIQRSLFVFHYAYRTRHCLAAPAAQCVCALGKRWDTRNILYCRSVDFVTDCRRKMATINSWTKVKRCFYRRSGL